MRVLLVNPTESSYKANYIPYALLFIRANLEHNGHDVDIVDFQLGYKGFESYRVAVSKKPDILGISLFCGPGVELAMKAVTLCRRLSPKTIIVFGGVLPSLIPETVLRDVDADYVLRFEGEETFSKLVEALERGDNHPQIANLAYLDDGKVKLQPRAPLLDLNKVPPLRFEDVNNEKYVIKNSPIGKRGVTIFTSKGCPYGCTFCYNRVYNDGKWRPFPTQWVLDTIDKLVISFDIDTLYVFDDDFFVKVKRVREIMESVRKRGHNLKWWAEIRVDQILSIGINELEELYELGLRELYIAPESGSDRILKILNKGFTVEDTFKANQLLARTRLLSLYSLMIGIPSETLDETMQTIDLAVKLRASNHRASIWQIISYIPYPNTPLYDIAIEYGLKPFTTLSDWFYSFASKPNKMPWVTLTRSQLRCIGYASLFQKSDSYIDIQPLVSRNIYKIFRAIFLFRMRTHVFLPFFDVWFIKIYVEFLFLLRKRLLK